MQKTVLIVSGNPADSRCLGEIAARLGLNVQSHCEKQDLARATVHLEPDLIILGSDIDGNSSDTPTILRRLLASQSIPKLTVIDANGEADTARNISAPLQACLLRPFTHAQAQAAIADLVKLGQVENEMARIRLRLDARPGFAEVIAVSNEMQRALVLAQRAADIDMPVLLEGEPGTGKRLLAKAIHTASNRAMQDLHAVRFPQSDQPDAGQKTAASVELFERVWVEAAGKSLFLEEISELPAECQERLNILLAEQSSRHDDTKETVRLICSSTRNLIEEVKKGTLREDLYFRINVFPIWMPPLRDRREDIIELANHFLKQVVVEEGKPIDLIDAEACALLRAYVWPGNVRQLENAVFRAVALADSHRLTLREFPQIATQVPGFKASMPSNQPMSQPPHFEGPAMIGGDMPNTRPVAMNANTGSAAIGIPVLSEDGEIRRLEDIEADLIRLALGHYRGHITEVARRLGIGRSTLYRKMREFGLSGRHNSVT